MRGELYSWPTIQGIDDAFTVQWNRGAARVL
jgi:hypothetical protein